MSGTVNIGTIEAQLKLVDLFLGPMKEISKKLDTITDSIERDLNKVDKSVDRLGSSFSNLGKEVVGNLTKYFTATVLVSGGVAALTSITKQLVTANIEAEASEKKVEESVRRYGESSGVTVDQINDLASAMSRLSGLDDEAIADAEALALKYNRITTDVLPRLTQAALDLSVATGSDLPSAFEKAGKLVNQPLKALTLLSKEGYAVSKSQAEMVKSLVKANDILGAQGVILDILEGQYGGAAAAARDSMGGALTALGTTWENFLERIGQDKLGPLRQGVEALISLLESATENVRYVEIGFHFARSAVNGFVADSLEGIADVIDLLAKASSWSTILGNSLGQFNAEKLKGAANIARTAAEGAGAQAEESAGAALKALLGLSEGHKRGTAAALEQTEAEAKLGKELSKVQEAIRLSILEMQRRADNARDLYLAALIGIKAYNAELLKQKVLSAILQEENKLRETGGKLTEIQRNSIAKAVIDEDYFNKKLQETLNLYKLLIQSALTATDNIARMGFDRDFQAELNKIHTGIELINSDVEEMLNTLDLDRGLTLDLDFSSRLNSIDSSLVASEERYLNFLERIGSGFEQSGETALDAGERILIKMGERFGLTIDEIRKKIETLNDINLAIDFKSQLDVPDTATKRLKELEKTLKRLSTTTDETGELLLTEAQAREIYNKALSEGLIEFASSAMTVIEMLYSVSSESNKWGKALSGLSGVVSSGGYNIAAWLELFIGLAEGFTDKGGVHAGAELNTGAAGAGLADSWTMVKGQLKEIQKQAQEIADAINDTILDLGGILVDLPGIELLQKGEGWVVNIEGEMRRYFEDFNEAIAYATSKAIAESEIYNIDDEVLKAFKDLDFSSLEEIREFTDYAKEYTSYGASELTTGLRSLTEWLLESSRKAIEFGLSIAKVGEEFGRRAQAWRDQILGIVLSPEEKLHRDVEDFNKWAEQERLSAQIQIDAAKAQLAAAQMQMSAAWAELKAAGKDADPETRALFLEAQRLFKEAGVRLDLWTKALENIPPAITPEEEEAAKKRKRGGGGKGNQKEGVRDFIEDKEFELSTRGLDEYSKRVLEIGRQYEQQLEQAGKDQKLRMQLIELKEQELALLAEENKLSVKDSYENFINQSNAFKEIRDTAAEFIKSINNSAFGNPEKAAMIGNILAETERQIEQLSLESAASVLGGLLTDLEKYGASEALQVQVRQHLAFIEHTLRMITLRKEIEILRLNGQVADAVISAMDRSLAFLEGIDPTEFLDGEGDSVQERQAAALAAYNRSHEQSIRLLSEFVKKFNEAKNLLAKYKDQGIDPLTKELKQIAEDFIKIKDALGSTSEVINEENRAIQLAYRNALSGLEDFYESLLNGADSALTVAQRYEVAQNEFNRILSEVQSGDFSELADLDQAGQEFVTLLGQMFGTSTQGFQDIKSDILNQVRQVLALSGLSGVSAASTNPVPATILQFPPQLVSSSQASVESTNNIADVINIRSARQEALLTQIANKVNELIETTREIHEENKLNRITYG